MSDKMCIRDRYSMVGELLAVRYSLRISVYKGINVMSIGDYEYILETYGITDIDCLLYTSFTL